jgi:hypothetical protein
MILDRLTIYDSLAFIIGVSIGVFILYIYKPPPIIIIRHPTPHNTENTIYKHTTDDSCYKYVANEVQCDNTALDHPIIT